MSRFLTAALAAAIALSPTAATAQVTPPEPPLPCPWWQCGGENKVVVSEYRVDTYIEDAVATTRVHQVLRNDGRGVAEGDFLMPIPAAAGVTGLTLWIDGEPVSGEILDGESARRTYEEIVRRTLDPALLEFADDGLIRLAVFPIPAGEKRTVEIEYREVLESEAGLIAYRQPLASEHSTVPVESVVASIEIHTSDRLKTVYSPSHEIAVTRPDPNSATLGYESSAGSDRGLTVYFSTDSAPVSANVISYRDGEDGWFLLLASPGLTAADEITQKDIALVVDVSGSMEGEKLAQAQRAAGEVLAKLNPGDRFDVVAFSTGTSSFGNGSLQPVTRAPAATDWVNSLGAGGSTDIFGALSGSFRLAEPGRPLYVIFLTDGLATEGITDTAEILAALDGEAASGISLFSFGVGFDVDTVLLDSISQDHHGASQYVVPGEAIDTAVATLYAKVASPVMTGVALSVAGVTVSDLQPTPLPDIFSGEQLVVAGKYLGSGPATVTLSGTLDGEPVAITYDEITFATSGGEPAIPTIWATRKIGELLRSIRIQGPDLETIDQIVRISIRHGIVTPYTSYLVTEDGVFGEEAVDAIARDAAATTTIPAASGEAAVTAADAAAEMSAAASAPPPGATGELVASAGGRTLRLTEGVWIDTSYDPAMTTIAVPFGSDAYFALAASSPMVAAMLAVGPRVTVVADGAAYTITAATAATTSTTVATDAGAGTTTATTSGVTAGPGNADDPQQAGPSAVLVALAAALAAITALAVAARRHG